MKKNILSVIGAATVAAVALKLTTKYVKNEVIKELEDDGYLYDDDDCDDCDECCGCDERIDDIHHAPVAAVHVIRVERKHDETKKDTDKATEANPDADKDESGKVDSDSASEVTKAKDESAEKPVEEKAAEEKKNPKLHRWVCKICGYVYEGESLPADYICPLCKHGAEDFEQID